MKFSNPHERYCMVKKSVNKPAIGIDSRMIRSTGIGTYLRNLLSGLQHQLQARPVLYGNPEQLQSFSFPVKNFQAPIYSVKEQAVYPFLLGQCDLWHAPHYNIPVFRPPGTKLVVTIHDLIHWVFKNEYFSKVQNLYAYVMLNAAVSGSDHIITVSEHTKHDLVHMFHAPESKISVIYEAVEEHFQPTAEISDIQTRYGLPDRYFLHVGSLKPHKNIQWLVHAFRQWHAGGKIKTPLVLVGKKDSSYKPELKELAELESDPIIIHIKNVEAIEDLVKIYSGATALIHPSLYEGFGLTLLEAMACGTPVITSPNASIPEVVGDSALMVPSSDADALLAAVEKLESDPAVRREWSEKGLQHVKQFSWAETARKTAQVYESVLEKKIGKSR